MILLLLPWMSAGSCGAPRHQGRGRQADGDRDEVARLNDTVRLDGEAASVASRTAWPGPIRHVTAPQGTDKVRRWKPSESDGGALVVTVEQHSEVERKYDVDAGSPVPGTTRASQLVELHQVATYYDTQDLRLLLAHLPRKDLRTRLSR